MLRDFNVRQRSSLPSPPLNFPSAINHLFIKLLNLFGMPVLFPASTVAGQSNAIKGRALYGAF